jgi:tetratricopeptide (TPR) repeat protein
MNAKLYDKSIDFLQQCIDHDYNPDASYANIITIYQEMGDTLKSVEVMKDGFEKYPDNQRILFALINYYIDTNNSEEAISYLNKAIAGEPTNASLYFAKGSALDKLGRSEEALEVYLESIKVDPEFANAYYNIGVYYFNKGVNQVEVANAVPTNKPDLYETEKAKANDEFKKAVPYMEKAMALNPTDTFIMDHLKNLYYRLNMMDKFKEIKEKME